MSDAARGRIEGAGVSVVVTRATGGTAKPVGVLYIEPDRQVLDAGAAPRWPEAGVDAGVRPLTC